MRERIAELEAENARLQKAFDETHFALNMALHEGQEAARERDEARAQLAERAA